MKAIQFLSYILTTIFCICQAVSLGRVHSEWLKFQNIHGKSYRTKEEANRRFQIFSHNLKKIEAHNVLYEKKLVSWEMGVTPYTDLTGEEFVNTFSSKKLTAKKTKQPQYIFDKKNYTSVPEQIDWNALGVVKEAQDQQLEKCNSCWAFSIGGAVESHLKIHQNISIRISEQHLLDCAKNDDYNILGCDGGSVPGTFSYMIDEGFIDEKDYKPYKARVGKCVNKKPTIRIKGYVDVEKENEESLRQAIGSVGPVVVNIELTYEFENYKSGIFDGTCSPHSGNHGVLAVGYGEENGIKYWLLRNSFGKEWGINGFMKLKRNSPSTCQITENFSSFPIV